MEENREELEMTPDTHKQETQSSYVPRPMWQVWAARVGLVVFLIILALYYGVMFFGGK